MQKFKPQSCVSNFCNKSNLSTPCFVAFHSVWVHLGPFRYCMILGAKWAELVQIMKKFVPQSRVGIYRKERTRSTRLEKKNSCLVAFRSLWVHLRPFRYCMKLNAKWAKLVQLMQKFMTWSHIAIIRKECTRSAPMDPKLTFCYIS